LAFEPHPGNQFVLMSTIRAAQGNIKIALFSFPLLWEQQPYSRPFMPPREIWEIRPVGMAIKDNHRQEFYEAIDITVGQRCA
jgi:hypothetical protein